MQLEDVICLAAASLLAEKVRGVTRDGWPSIEPTNDEIQAAVRVAEKIWHATLNREEKRDV